MAAVCELTTTVGVGNSPLGWIAVVTGEHGVTRVSLGHSSRDRAVHALGDALGESAYDVIEDTPEIQRLCAYANGEVDDLCDIQVELRELTTFQRRVLSECRKIPYGATVSYGELAARAGRPGAARAVGNTMALNPLPLIVPCHRVVPSSGKLGRYSAPGGTRTKQALLDLEAAGA